MTTSLDTVYAWQDLPVYRRHLRQSSSSPLPLRQLHLISDPTQIRNLPMETPVFASIEEAHAFLRDSNPAPDLNLTYIHNGSRGHYGPPGYFVDIMDTPIYCGPDSPDTLLALSFRFPSIWVPSYFANTAILPFPLHVTTKTCLNRSYTLVLNSPSVIKRVKTRRSNIASRIEDITSGGPLLPLSLFPPIYDYLRSVRIHPSSPTVTYRTDKQITDGRIGILQYLQSHLLSIPDPAHFHGAFNPLARRIRDSMRTRTLLLTLIPLLPHFPILRDPSPLKDTPYKDLYSHLFRCSSPYWRDSYGGIHNPLFNEGLTASGKTRRDEPETTNGTLLAALIAREIRIGLRLQNLTLTRARTLLPS